VQKEKIQICLLFAIKTTVLSAFWQKKGVGILGINDVFFLIHSMTVEINLTPK